MKRITLAAVFLLVGVAAPAGYFSHHRWTQNVSALAQDSEDVTRDLIRVRQRPEDELWLRLNAKGHTGTVQAVAFLPDSKRLVTAGLDKSAMVWNLQAVGRDLKRAFLRERTLRWQVARSLRGSIYATAVNPTDGSLAMGGYGAMGSLGEIVVVDPLQGDMKQVLNVNRQTVTALAYSADGQWLASNDVFGNVVTWKTGDWTHQTVYAPDLKTYGAPRADAVAKQPRLRPLAMVGSKYLAVPVLVSTKVEPKLQWRVNLINLNDRKEYHLLDTVHFGVVTALAASRDGRYLASSDLTGKTYLWDVATRRSTPLAVGRIANSLAFSADGATLAVGTIRDPDNADAELQVWNVAARTQTRKRNVTDHVAACAVSDDGKLLAYSGGKDHEVFVERLAGDDQPTALKGVGRRIMKVAFSAQDPLRVAYGTQYRDRGFNDAADLEEAFDPMRLELQRGAEMAQDDWLPTTFGQGDWTAKLHADGTLRVSQAGVERGALPIDQRLMGRPRCYCWVPDAQGRPFAVAVGVDRQSAVLVFRLDTQNNFPLLRHFRGHNDYVASVGVSRDARFLVSGSSDGTVRLWSLDQLAQGRALPGSWGAAAAVENGKLTLKTVNEAGPMFRKGMRAGDVITSMRWYGQDQSVSEALEPADMLKRLSELPWTAQVGFEFTRNGQPRKPFQALPAWEQLATLFVASDGEWAYWTPDGYYDASMNGHTLFGWQVNRGLDQLPNFYRADQFRKTLERPDVMQHLLTAGSVSEAFRRAQLAPPAEPETVLIEHIAVTPIIRILSPKTGDVLQADNATVRAQIRLPGEGKMVSARVFANGVVSPTARIVEQRDVPGGKEFIYEWTAAVPSDSQNLIQVMVGTDAPTAAFHDVVVSRPATAEPPPQPRLFVLSVGVNEYQDSNIQPLNFSVADAVSVADTLKSRAAALYHIDAPTVMTNDQVTRKGWRKSFEELSERLKKEVKPNDVLVLFLAGHGFVDETTNKYYYASHDLKIDDFLNNRFEDCISWSDFELLKDIPCRKVAFLDTCHSGAIQPLQQRNLKSAVRGFQEDVVFTVTASLGSERSAENPDWGHGAFTKCLLEGLNGSADTSGDGVISLPEIVDYVKRTVPALTDDTQHPTAAPDELFPYISLGLTQPTK